MYAVIRPALDSAAKKIVRYGVLWPLFFLEKSKKIRLERWLRGREQYGKLVKSDVVIASFGKSGRTWLRVMLSRFYQVRHGLSQRLLIGFDNFHLRDRAIPRIFFTHDNYVKDYTGNAGSKADYYDRKVVLLVRDPVDVAVSQYHQWKFRMRPGKKDLNKYPEHGAEVPIFDFVAKHEAGLQKVVDFMNLWASEMPRLKDLLIVRYEDMKAAPEATMRRLVAFMGTPGTDAEIAEAVRFGSFENMRKLEEKRAFWLAGGRMVAKDKSNPESFKVRRGKVGGWRDYFSEDEARALERLVDAKLLPAFGYTSAEHARTAVPA